MLVLYYMKDVKASSAGLGRAGDCQLVYLLGQKIIIIQHGV